MGNHSSKKSSKKKNQGFDLRQTQSAIDLMENENDGGEMSQKKYDEVEVYKLKRELMETPQVFVLNNLLMSIMFFENYEKDKSRSMQSSRTSTKKELNPTLLRDETTECVMPDVIFESVNKNVRYRRYHGANKNKIEPLVPRRMFVINDKIEVTESRNPYYAIDKPNYQVIMEDSEHSGFVKMKCTTPQVKPMSKPIEQPVNKNPQPGPSTQSDSKDSDIYEYSNITMVNTPKPIDIQNCERRDTLPKSCFTIKKVRKYDATSDTEDSDEDPDERKARNTEDLYDLVSYISSDGFMTYFQNAVFPNSLGQALGFDMTEIKLAKTIPGKIFCNLQDVEEDIPSLPCEIIPSVAIQWPIHLTFEFHARSERPTMWDKFRGEYRWPRDHMIKEISGMRCALVPRGYIPKRGENEDSEIEWDIGFPQAERYLDTHMDRTQVRAFLFLLTIFKTYIEPMTKYHGLLVEHIRTHIYWECENNPRDWPEHRLGTKIILIIKNLIQRLSEGQLPDFFIKKKNTFENVPNKYLKHAQKIFHNVVQSPAVYFIGALRNLSYASSKFYPRFDFKSFYNLLTTENCLHLVNAGIINSQPPNLNPKKRRPLVQGDTNYRNEVKWKIKKEKLNREKHLQRLKEQKEREENLKVERRGSIDSVDYEWQCEKQFDTIKIREILFFFINHFVEIAKKSSNLSSPKLALFYLKQAYYLTKLLQEVGLRDDAQKYFETIAREEESLKKKSVRESFELPPTTPKRNSGQFNFEITQQVKGNNIKRANLNKSYNSTQNFIKKHPSSNLKSKPSVLRNGFVNDDRRKSLESPKKNVVEFSEAIEVR